MNFVLYGIRGNTRVLLWRDNCKYNIMIYISEHVFLVRQVAAKGAGGRNHGITVDLNVFIQLCVLNKTDEVGYTSSLYTKLSCCFNFFKSCTFNMVGQWVWQSTYNMWICQLNFHIYFYTHTHIIKSTLEEIDCICFKYTVHASYFCGCYTLVHILNIMFSIYSVSCTLFVT